MSRVAAGITYLRIDIPTRTDPRFVEMEPNLAKPLVDYFQRVESMLPPS
jgi:hypothetical protein